MNIDTVTTIHDKEALGFLKGRVSYFHYEKLFVSFDIVDGKVLLRLVPQKLLPKSTVDSIIKDIRYKENTDLPSSKPLMVGNKTVVAKDEYLYEQLKEERSKRILNTEEENTFKRLRSRISKRKERDEYEKIFSCERNNFNRDSS
jgi:hypothetical protein